MEVALAALCPISRSVFKSHHRSLNSVNEEVSSCSSRRKTPVVADLELNMPLPRGMGVFFKTQGVFLDKETEAGKERSILVSSF
jgi:hypothetical protein